LESTSLVGRWESHKTSKGGIGHVLDFKQDGSYISSVSVLVNLKYRVEGNTLHIVELDNANQTTEPGTKFRIEGDKLISTLADGSEQVAVRVQPAENGTDSIVGAWSYTHYAGGTAYERYTVDNKLAFRLPMTSSVGCYLPDQKMGVVLMAPLNGKETTTNVHVDGMRLELKEEGKDPFIYDKSPWGEWYSLGGNEQKK
jgi:hypothetical protein